VTKDRLNPLLVAAALLYFAVSLPLLFAPDELLSASGVTPTAFDGALLQLLAAALFGFAMFNWLQRSTVTGGIYGRPLVMANLAHTAIAALSLLHLVRRGTLPTTLLTALVLYGVLALAFAWTLFRRIA